MTDRDDALAPEPGPTDPAETDYQADLVTPPPREPHEPPEGSVPFREERGMGYREVPGRPPAPQPPPREPRPPAGGWGGPPGWQQPRPPRPPAHPGSPAGPPRGGPGPQWPAPPSGADAAEARPPVESYAERIRADELVPTRRHPPARGWRRALYRATFGLVNLGQSPEETARRNSRPRSARCCAATTRSACSARAVSARRPSRPVVGSVFAELRQDDRVVAIDADTAFGKLGSRIDPNAAGSYWELAADEHLDTLRRSCAAGSATTPPGCSCSPARLAGAASGARPGDLPRGHRAAGPALHDLDRRLRLDDGLAGHPGGAARPRRTDRGVLAVGRRRRGGRPDHGVAGQPRADRASAAHRGGAQRLRRARRQAHPDDPGATVRQPRPGGHRGAVRRASAPRRGRSTGTTRDVRRRCVVASSRSPRRSPSTSPPPTTAIGNGSRASLSRAVRRVR